MKHEVKLLTFAGVLFLGATALQAQARDDRASDPVRERVGALLREHDVDGDGALTEKEVGRLWVRIAPTDANKDGKVTGREMYAAWSSDRADVEVKKRVEGVLARMDKDKDGTITKDEAGDFWARIASTDADKDGKVTAREMYAAWAKDVDPVAQRIEGLLTRFDKDKDGVLTQAEAGELWARIVTTDADKDGKVTKMEMYAAWSRVPKSLEDYIKEVAASVETGRLTPQKGKEMIEAYKQKLAQEKAERQKRELLEVEKKLEHAQKSGRITPEQAKQRLAAYKKKVAQEKGTSDKKPSDR